MINDDNFKIRGFWVTVEYNDFSFLEYTFKETNQEKVVEMIINKMKKKTNCDPYYLIELMPIYEIKNKEYLSLKDGISIEDKLKKYLKKEKLTDNYIMGKSITIKLKTEENQIPKNVVLLEKINQIELINTNGDTMKENVKQKINLLEQML